MLLPRSWRWWGIGTAGALIAIAMSGALAVSGASPATETVFVPVVSCRLVDTRPPTLVGPRAEPIGENSPVTFTAWETGDSTSVCEIPVTATAISTNTTIVNPTAASYLTLYSADAPTPTASNLNYGAGQAATPNAVTTSLSKDGEFNVFNRFGAVDVVIDVNGYYQPSTMTGEKGDKGDPGDKGDKGDKGDPGADGVGGREVVTQLVTLGSDGSTGELLLPCPTGKVPIGAGHASLDDSKRLDVWRNGPQASSWLFSYTVESGGSGRAVNFTVICATP